MYHDDCTSETFSAGESFTDLGCGDIHNVRNEGATDAIDVAVQIVPNGAMRREDKRTRLPKRASLPVILRTRRRQSKERKGPIMNPLTQFKAIRLLPLLIAPGLIIGGALAAYGGGLPPDPVIYWSNEARKAIVPPSAGAENYGRGAPLTQPCTWESSTWRFMTRQSRSRAAMSSMRSTIPHHCPPPNTSAAAAIATAAHHTLVGLPCGLNDAEANILNGIYNNYMVIPDGEAKTNGIVLGQRVAQVIVGLRQNDGRCVTPTFTPPPPGPGVWQPNTWPGPLPVGVSCRERRRSRSRARRSSVPMGQMT